ncbi:cysteine-tryptophan domain-containing zinc finger protein 7-like [Musa acuminata AAA Group]|uniref:cysteine-tryptophan domain-containing zinc finger protein 7 n=1 Tax=Musa acuminata AAA Group TaxID=214697 RepID=UPI0031DE006D
MLSVGRRGDGRKELGFGGGGMEGENELEEGEAYSGQEDDSCIDPDALSYIDEKIQNVLGHFQKDFEAGVSAENLGAKFGGYGSFLPAYQRSPSILCQTKSPQKVPNQNVTKSPYNPSVEVTYQNPSVMMSSSFPKNNTVAVPPSDESCKRDMSINKPNIQEPTSQHGFNKTVSGTDHKTLKVRIKVGPDNDLARIYSGLGLDISPSSSSEDSPSRSGGISPEFQVMPDESPKTIIQVMTCLMVPGGFLLSPLQDSLFQLTEEDSSFIKQCQGGKTYHELPQTSTGSADFTLHLAEVKCQMENHSKSTKQKAKPREIKSSEGKADLTTSWEIDTETQVRQELASNSLNMSSSSFSKNAGKKGEKQIVGSLTKNDTNMSDHSRETKKASLKDGSTFPGLMNDKHFELFESTTNNVAGNSGNEVMLSNEQHNSKASMLQKAFEEQSTNNHKDEKSNLQSEGRSKVEKYFAMTNTHSNGSKRKNEQITEPDDHVKPSSPPYKEKTLQRKDQISDGKKKVKLSQANSESFGNYLKDSISGNSSAMPKEKKKTSHAKAGHAEKKSKVLNSRTDSSGAGIRESSGYVNWDAKTELLENGVGSLDFRSKGKQKAIKAKLEKEPIMSTHIFNEKPIDRNAEKTQIPGASVSEKTQIPGAFVSGQIFAPSSTYNAPAMGATVAPQPPVFINEHWVCCDICQKWRLLPYGTDPDHLPKKWQCSLLNWLPRMNSCDISEEETTNALRALYLVPAPENSASLNVHHDVVSTNVSWASGVHLGQNLEPGFPNVPTVAKKKSGLKCDLDLPHSTSGQFSNSVKKDQHTSVKFRSSNDANQYPPFELNSSNKGVPGDASRSSDFNAEKQKPKQKDKHKKRGSYSDGGDHSGKIEKHSKSKSKREVDQDDLRAPKKPKKESLQYPSKDCSEHDVGDKVFVETDVGGSSNKVIANNEPRWNSFPLSKGSKCDLNGNYSSSKKLGDEVQSITNGESKQHFVASDVDKLSIMDISTKKKKGKERQGSQHGEEVHVTTKHVLENEVIVQRAPGPAEPVRDKKAELTMSVGKGSKTTKLNDRMDTKGNMTKMILPASGEHLTSGMDNEVPYVVEKKHRSSQRSSQSEGNIASQRALDFDSSKRDVMFTQPPVAEAANSSSSKVSGSRKSRSNLQETKGSPVESVSSSPLRIPSIEKLSHKIILEQRNGATNSGFPALGKPRICSDSEFDGGNGRSVKGKKPFSVQQQSLETHKAANSGILDSLEGTSDYLRKERNKSSDGKSEERLHVKLSAQNDSSPAELGKHSYRDDIQDMGKVNGHQLVNDSSQRKSGKNSSGFKEKHRGSKSVLDKSRLKVSGSYNEHKDLHSLKNGSNGRREASFVSGEHCVCPDDLRNEEGNFQGEDEKEFLGKKDPNSKYMTGRRGNSSTSAVQEDMDGVPSSFSNPQRDLDSKIPVGTRCVKPDFQVGPSFHNEKALNHPYLDRINCPEPPSGLGKSQLKLSCDKLDTHPRGRHMVTSPLKASRSDDVADAVNSDTSKVVKQHRLQDCHNGLHNNNLRHATPFVSDSSSPLRKENCAAVLKEARDLKHSANRLKSEGLELESTGLYFEAALKFLHVAALMEPVNFDSAKQAEAAQMYFETAKLCEFVAHEYEKVKIMAAVSLAYKCVEVAYLKTTYCKSPNATKDRHELQSAFQILPPGESPSSSSSDVDNLNNQAILGKNASAKGVSSPQVAGNHVIAARHHHQVVRLLHYTNYLNCAFEATRKSEAAFAAASVSPGKDRTGCLSSVRKVLDFNFHNVEELLRFVRLSLESIGR